MPTYEYRCPACEYQFEHFQSITADPLKTCPSCKRRTLRRLIGVGGGIIFRGSGFYQTDYRSESYKQAADAEKKTLCGSTESTDTGAPVPEKATASKKPPKSKKKPVA